MSNEPKKIKLSEEDFGLEDEKKAKKRPKYYSPFYKDPYSRDYDYRSSYYNAPIDPQEIKARKTVEVAKLLEINTDSYYNDDYMYHTYYTSPKISVKFLCPVCGTEFTYATKHSYLIERGTSVDCICGAELKLSFNYTPYCFKPMTL